MVKNIAAWHPGQPRKKMIDFVADSPVSVKSEILRHTFFHQDCRHALTHICSEFRYRGDAAPDKPKISPHPAFPFKKTVVSMNINTATAAPCREVTDLSSGGWAE